MGETEGVVQQRQQQEAGVRWEGQRAGWKDPSWAAGRLVREGAGNWGRVGTPGDEEQCTGPSFPKLCQHRAGAWRCWEDLAGLMRAWEPHLPRLPRLPAELLLKRLQLPLLRLQQPLLELGLLFSLLEPKSEVLRDRRGEGKLKEEGRDPSLGAGLMKFP